MINTGFNCGDIFLQVGYTSSAMAMSIVTIIGFEASKKQNLPLSSVFIHIGSQSGLV